MAIIQRQRRTSQPQQPVGIDWANPLSRGLKIAITGGYLIDLANRDNISGIGAGISTRTTSRGIGLAGDGTQTAGALTLPDKALYSTTEFSVAVGFFTASTSTQLLIGQWEGAGSTLSWLNEFDTQFYCGASDGANALVKKGGSISTTGLNNFVQTVSLPTGLTLYQNGVSQSLSNVWVTGTLSTVGNSPNNVKLLSTNDGKKLNGTLVWAFYWNRALTPEESNAVSANPWQLFAPIQRRIWVGTTAGGGTTIDLNVLNSAWDAVGSEIKEKVDISPSAWSWESVSSEIKEKIDLSPQFWTWETTSGSIVEYVSTVIDLTPQEWVWQTTSGSIQEGTKTTIDLLPAAWSWDIVSGSFVQKIDLSIQEFVWQTISAGITENIDVTPIAWSWDAVAGSVLGTDEITIATQAWEWEPVSGSIAYIQPQQESGTIGGKPDKHIKWPFYDKDHSYESKIDLDEMLRDDNRPVADFLDVNGNVRRSDGVSDGKRVELESKTAVADGKTIGELVEKLVPQIGQVSVIEFPQVEESDGFDEEAAVIMLLLAA